jgi:hypothetical protein
LIMPSTLGVTSGIPRTTTMVGGPLDFLFMWLNLIVKSVKTRMLSTYP